jgi:L-cysteate sulfo-lyase
MQAAMESIADELRTAGKRPYVMPGGGSVPIGALGYVNCAFEIVEQIKERNIDIDMVIHATGSAGTQAGLLVGFELADIKLPVLGISTRLPQKPQEEKVYKLVQETAEFLQIRKEIDRSVVRANSDYVGEGYGIPTQGMIEAVSALAKWEGILLDPVYSGKGMHGLIDLIANKSVFSKDQNILFLHTGGNVGLFGYLNEFKE